MKTYSFVVILGILVSQISFAVHYLCERLDDAQGTNVYSIDKRNTIKLTIEEPGVAKTIVNITSSTRPMKFATSSLVKKDNSKFSERFEVECHDFSAIEGYTVMSVDWLGAYAGISPVIDERYVLFDSLKNMQMKFDISIPSRTMVIFSSSGTPLSEFFCYESIGE